MKLKFLVPSQYVDGKSTISSSVVDRMITYCDGIKPTEDSLDFDFETEHKVYPYDQVKVVEVEMPQQELITNEITKEAYYENIEVPIIEVTDFQKSDVNRLLPKMSDRSGIYFNSFK